MLKSVERISVINGFFQTQFGEKIVRAYTIFNHAQSSLFKIRTFLLLISCHGADFVAEFAGHVFGVVVNMKLFGNLAYVAIAVII